MSFEQAQHSMIHQGTDENGEDEYYCPTCGRHILLQMDPYKKTVLDAGDEYAIHSGGMGGLVMGQTEITSSNEQNAVADERLAAWEIWLEELNFESFWDQDN